MLYLEKNKQDEEMLNLYSEREGVYVLWAVVHGDMLEDLGLQHGIDEAEIITLKQDSYLHG
jgi:hypothetical protein